MDLNISFEDSIFGTERKILLSKFPIAPLAKEAEPNRIRKRKNVPLAKGRERYMNPGGLFSGRFHLFGNAPSAREKERFPLENATLVPDTAFPKKRGNNGQSSPGIRDGEAISLPGLGEAVAGGIAGDLYVKFTVGKHPIFRRDNLNLVMDLDVKMSEALLGAEKDIATLDGPIKLKVPAGINSGEVLVARGRGVPQGHGLSGSRGRGDLMIKIIIRTPRKISKKAKDLIEELKKEGI